MRRHHIANYLEYFGSNARLTWIAVGLVLVLQFAFTHLPVMNTLFRSMPISATDWIIWVAIASIVFIFVELEKILRRGFMER